MSFEVSAQRGGVTARRLLGETAEYRGELLVALGSILLGAGAQAAAPWLVSRAIDGDILNGDAPGLARTLAGLLAVYALGTWPRGPRSFRLGPWGSACWLACAVGCSSVSGGCRSRSSIVDHSATS